MDKYDKQIKAIRMKREKEREEKEKVLLPQYKKEWIGRCFKTKNCYSCPDKPSDYWNLYVIIIDIDYVNYIHDGSPEPHFVVLKFQNCKREVIEFQLKDSMYRFDEDWEEINRSEFVNSFNKNLGILENILESI